MTSVLTLGAVNASAPAGIPYVVRGARIVTMAGATIESGTIVMRNGVIEEIGASATVPADAIVVDGAGLTVYPGLIDLGQRRADRHRPAGNRRPAGRGGGGGGGGRGGGGAASEFATLEEADRAKRAAILRPDYMAADHLRTSSPALSQLASAGITTVLAVPGTGIFKGQSALVNVAIPADDPQISAVGDYRKGLAVVKSPVASHIDMAGRGGGQGYPGSLLGTIAFTRQGLLDGQWQRDAEALLQAQQRPRAAAARRAVTRRAAARARASDSRGARRQRSARDRSRAGDGGGVQSRSDHRRRRARHRAHGGAREGEGARHLQSRICRAAAAPARRGGGGGGGGRGGGGGTSLRVMKEQAEAPKVPAALAQASIPFGFTSGGLTTAGDFVRNAGRVASEGGLSAEATLRALTIDAARLAGAADRLGSLERGKIANLVVVEGRLAVRRPHPSRVHRRAADRSGDAAAAATAGEARPGGGRRRGI